LRDGKDGINDDANSEIRQQIYRYIEKNPGVHLRKISRELGLAMGNTQYHLQMLEKDGRIRTRRATLYRHYYPVGILYKHDEVILQFLRQETTRDILVRLLENPAGMTQSEIIQFKNLSAPTISWHMSRLVESGLVVRMKEGKTVRYTIAKDLIEGMTKLLRAYHPTVWNKLAGRLAELFFELSARERGGQ
jgi:predicted transcriptional regulator